MSLGNGSISSVVLRLGLGLGFLSAVADRFGLWGTPWTTEHRVGQLLTVLGIHAQPQLVFAGRNDPAAGSHRHRR